MSTITKFGDPPPAQPREVAGILGEDLIAAVAKRAGEPTPLSVVNGAHWILELGTGSVWRKVEKGAVVGGGIEGATFVKFRLSVRFTPTDEASIIMEGDFPDLVEAISAPPVV